MMANGGILPARFVTGGKCPRCSAPIEVQGVNPDNTFWGRCPACRNQVAGTLHFAEQKEEQDVPPND